MAQFSLRFTGANASSNELDFYDAAQAMLGFQRSLALSAHLATNGEIITQAPALKNAQIFVQPPREGSFEVIAMAAFGMAGAALVASKDSVAGHFTRSIYDYVLKSFLGEHVDFEKTIGAQYSELCELKKITESKLDSLVEKSETAIVNMHRPIVWSETARRAKLTYGGNRDALVGPTLTPETYEHATRTVKLKKPEIFKGFVSSYNSNTYKGRIFLKSELRPVPFQLADDCRGRRVIKRVTESLSINAQNRGNPEAEIAIRSFRHESSTGRLKALWITDVAKDSESLS